MSIINDALKKLQTQRSTPPASAAVKASPTESKQSVEQTKPLQTQQPPPTAQNTYQQKTTPQQTQTYASPEQHTSKRSILIYLLVIVCGLIGFSLMKSSSHDGSGIIRNPTISLPALTSHQEPRNSSSTSIAPKGVVLHGIIASDGKHSALINEDIYQIGDTINGMPITAILEDRVVLSQGSNEVILKVKGKK